MAAGPTLALALALDAERFVFDGISCYVAGQGAPLLLVHTVNAAASAAEVRPLFDHYRATRTVFALDLPGYGHSDRSERGYTPRLMTDALHATAAQIRQRCGGSAPLDAIAASLGCEFLARAAVEQPPHWGRLGLVSPTGFQGRKSRRKVPGSTAGMGWLHRVLTVPLWSQALFDGLTRPAVVRYFLQRTWGSKTIDERLWAYCVQTAAQPGARHAPLDFLSGNLFSDDIHTVYEAITQPAWASHGVRGDFTDYRQIGIVSGRPNWHLDVFQSGALPYFEVPTAFMARCDRFLSSGS